MDNGFTVFFLQVFVEFNQKKNAHAGTHFACVKTMF